MKKGEIYFGINNLEGGHPIVFLADRDEYSFDGLMLTHSSGYGNIKLESEHFSYVEPDFKINNTHLVARRLIKMTEWEPFVKKGELSMSGLELVMKLIDGQEATYW